MRTLDYDGLVGKPDIVEECLRRNLTVLKIKETKESKKRRKT